MEGKVTLGYWKIRGLAERIRLLCEYIGLPYDQVKFYGAGEGRDKWFKQVKPELQKKNPAITIPYLLDGEKVITESDAICVYICHKANRKDLLGRNADEQVALYTALGVLKDMYHHYVKHIYGTYGQGATFDQALDFHRKFIQNVKPFAKKLSGLLGQQKFICGEQLVWIDFAIAEFFQALTMFEPLCLEDCPNLLAYQKRIWDLPELKNYFASERYIERPCNNVVAKWQ